MCVCVCVRACVRVCVFVCVCVFVFSGRMRLMYTCVLGRHTLLLPQSCQYPNLLVDASSVGGQGRGDKECLFSGVTSFGRVWRTVPERKARSVG